MAKAATLIVAADGTGDYRQIQPALDAARPGDTVWVRAGTYVEDLHLRTGVRLQGEGIEKTRVVAAVENALRAHDVRGSQVLDLSLDGGAKENHVTVLLVSSEVIIEGCLVTGATNSGIENEGKEGHLTLLRSIISDNQTAGVFVHNESMGILEDNTIEHNGRIGIAVQERGRLEARRNVCLNNSESGVFVYGKSEAVLANNVIRGNRFHGVTVREEGKVELFSNTIVHNSQTGVWVLQEGVATLDGNIIAFNGRRGVDAIGNPDETPASAVTLRRNCLWENHPDYKGELDHSLDLTADPRFVDLEGGDLHLRPDSPCIGSGLRGEDLGAFPFEREIDPESPEPPPRRALEHLRTLVLSHLSAPDIPFSRGASWLRGAATTGQPLPLGLAWDLGLLLTGRADGSHCVPPSYLVLEDTSAYVSFLRRLLAHRRVKEVAAWEPGLSDAALAVTLARLVEGAELPEAYRLPAGPAGTLLLRQLGRELDRAMPAEIWRQTPLAQRLRLEEVCPLEAMARIERNLDGLSVEELRFLSLYGPPLAGAPDPRELLDLLSLTGLPPEARLALGQTLKLLPRLSGGDASGGMQIYPEGGYEGVERQGSLDSLLPTELAYPPAVQRHRVLNREALYYGRQRPRESGRELAYLVVQSGVGLGGDGEVLARALLLGLAQALRCRGYEVLYSFAGLEVSPPRALVRPREVVATLYHREPGKMEVERVLRRVLERLRSWREVYRSRQVHWIVSEEMDADDVESHAPLYRALRGEASQQAWYVRVGKQVPAVRPATTGCFDRWQVLATEVLWQEPVESAWPMARP